MRLNTIEPDNNQATDMILEDLDPITIINTKMEK